MCRLCWLKFEKAMSYKSWHFFSASINRHILPHIHKVSVLKIFQRFAWMGKHNSRETFVSFFKRAGCQKISKAPRNKWRWRCLQRKKKKRHLLKSSSALQWHKETGCYNICQLSLLGKFKKSSSLYFRVWIFLAGTTVLNKWNSVD